MISAAAATASSSASQHVPSSSSSFWSSSIPFLAATTNGNNSSSTATTMMSMALLLQYAQLYGLQVLATIVLSGITIYRREMSSNRVYSRDDEDEEGGGEENNDDDHPRNHQDECTAEEGGRRRRVVTTATTTTTPHRQAATATAAAADTELFLDMAGYEYCFGPIIAVSIFFYRTILILLNRSYKSLLLTGDMYSSLKTTLFQKDRRRHRPPYYGRRRRVATRVQRWGARRGDTLWDDLLREWWDMATHAFCYSMLLRERHRHYCRRSKAEEAAGGGGGVGAETDRCNKNDITKEDQDIIISDQDDDDEDNSQTTTLARSSVTGNNHSCSSSSSSGGGHLLTKTLPPDVQCAILTYLDSTDVVHFGQVSSAALHVVYHDPSSCGVLWNSLIQRDYGHVLHWDVAMERFRDTTACRRRRWSKEGGGGEVRFGRSSRAVAMEAEAQSLPSSSSSFLSSDGSSGSRDLSLHVAKWHHEWNNSPSSTPEKKKNHDVASSSGGFTSATTRSRGLLVDASRANDDDDDDDDNERVSQQQQQQLQHHGRLQQPKVSDLYFLLGETWLPWSLATHNTTQSCLVGLHGDVYDITPFLTQHPGSLETLLAHGGGRDATQFFEDVRHSRRARSMATKLCCLRGRRRRRRRSENGNGGGGAAGDGENVGEEDEEGESGGATTTMGILLPLTASAGRREHSPWWWEKRRRRRGRSNSNGSGSSSGSGNNSDDDDEAQRQQQPHHEVSLYSSSPCPFHLRERYQEQLEHYENLARVWLEEQQQEQATPSSSSSSGGDGDESESAALVLGDVVTVFYDPFYDYWQFWFTTLDDDGELIPVVKTFHQSLHHQLPR